MMENPQNLPPSLIAFVFLSLILCIWAIVDIVRSSFTKLNKLLWLLIVLFAPFGIFIYFFIGRRLKPAGQERVSAAGPRDDVRPLKESSESAPHRNVTLPFLITLVATALLCVITYMNVVTLFGREKTGWILLSAMVVVGMILTFFRLSRRRRE